MERNDGSDRADPPVADIPAAGDQAARAVTDIPVAAGSVRWERPTARSFWNALADPEREAP